MSTIADEIVELRFFAEMSREDVELLAGCGRNAVFDPLTWLVRAGDQVDSFWVIREGRVALGVLAAGRGMVTLETLHRGDILGSNWLLPPFRWRFDAQALDTVHVVAFDAVCLRAKCDADPALGYHLARRFAAQLDERLQSARIQMLDVYGIATDR